MNLKKEELEKISPMMKEYLRMKEEYSDCILLYRLGDFYEMFFDDAIMVSKELELTLTGRSCGLEERAPMCGVPFHSVDSYLNRLVKNGHKVAICEQLEDPKEAKGIVKRGVTRVVTPGSTLNSMSLDENKNNYILSIVERKGVFGIATCDITTGDFFIQELKSLKLCVERIIKIDPSEILFDLESASIEDIIAYKENISHTKLNNVSCDLNREIETLLKQFKVGNISVLNLEGYISGIISAGELIKYLEDLQKSDLSTIRNIEVYKNSKYMEIDYATRRNLELIETMREKSKIGSFIHVLDKTKTAMGARKLREMVEEPLTNREEIIKRQDIIEELFVDPMLLSEVREYLSPIYDFERLLCRIIYKTANPRDMRAFMLSLHTLPDIKNSLSNMKSDIAKKMYEDFDVLDDLYRLIDMAIVEEPPFSVREGGIIKDGYDENVDNLRYAKNNGKSLLSSVEEEEREKTGITTLKVKYNKVFGYFIEVSKLQSKSVPDYYIRKQTLTNSERYIVPKLKELEDTILGAQDKLAGLEYELFVKVREIVAGNVDRVQKSAKIVAYIDALASLAYVSERNGYTRPNINDENILEIEGGRHPVVEMMNNDVDFIPNDTYLDTNETRINIITGPNMAGKSTYMRQVALIQLMAQMGSFVPASRANIGIVDRIFTRVGASDDLATGQSTFMVEMSEVANILRNATKNSLIILDEIGRGTSTYDGLSIAWSVTEEIANKIGAKTLFATHYHELTSLEGSLDGVHNFSIAVKEKGDDIIFLRKVIPGGADRSYGIQVAKLAGVPEGVIRRSKAILGMLVENSKGTDIEQTALIDSRSDNALNTDEKMADYALKYEEEIISQKRILDRIKNIDVNNMTPIEVVGKVLEIQGEMDKI